MSQAMSQTYRTCHRCGHQFTGHFCPCRRHSKSSASSARSSRRTSASRTVLPASTGPVSASLVPLWESDPDRFWGERVDRVRTAHNIAGDQFIIADFGNTSKLFLRGDVIEAVKKFWIVEPEGVAA